MDSDKTKNTGKAPEPTVDAEPKTSEVASTTAKTSAPASNETPAAAKPASANKNLWMMIAAIASVVIIVIVVVLFIVLGNKNKDNGDDSGNGGDSSQVDSDKDENKLDKTLAVTGMTMRYGSGWKVDKTDDDENGIYKGDDYYILLNHVDGAGKKFTTKEYAEAFLSAFEDNKNYDIREKPSATKVNGLEWQKAVVYTEGVWMTLWFYADGTDYYLATFGNMDSSKIPAEVQAMIDTLTIKKN